MNIEFSGKWDVDDVGLGVVFEALVDGRSVQCRVSAQALREIDSSYRNSSTELKFVANQEYFEEIAKTLIEGNRVNDGELLISSSDVPANLRDGFAAPQLQRWAS